MQDLGWRRRWGSCPAARRGARQRAGLTPASASNTLSCLLEMLHSKQLRSIKMLVDSNHGIYRGENPGPGKDVHGELDHRPGIREQPGSFASVLPPRWYVRYSVHLGLMSEIVGLRRRAGKL